MEEQFFIDAYQFSFKLSDSGSPIFNIRGGVRIPGGGILIGSWAGGPRVAFIGGVVVSVPKVANGTASHV